MTKRKRARPTRGRVKDADAIQSLLRFGIPHRAAIADHALRRFKATSSPVDRLSLAVEVFSCFMGSIEDLEMLYFALKEKTANPGEAFFAAYVNTEIREVFKRSKRKPTDKSARNMIRELKEASIERFRATLGLPDFEEWSRLWGSQKRPRREERMRYYKELRSLKKRILQAAQNRSVSRLMASYNKTKHGFAVLDEDGTNNVFLVERAKSLGRRTSSIQAIPFSVADSSVEQLVENTKNVALTSRLLLQLYARKLD
ncbi:MAG: hypothetical protein AABY65_01740 [Nitrospirota bacterium]